MFEIDEEVQALEHVIVPDGTISLSCAILPGMPPMLAIVGPSVLAYRRPVMPGAVYCGLRLRAGVAGSMLRRNIRTLAGQILPMAEAFPDLSEALGAELKYGLSADDGLDLLGQVVARLMHQADPIDAPVRDYCDHIVAEQGDVVLKTLAEAAPLGERQLRRRFLYQVGLTAKEFSRLRRVRHACACIVLGKGTPASASGQSGFSDQSHMSREFRHVFGSSQRLVTDYLSSIRHLGLA
ncbi:helix-turn-helix transcriptional regulator [Parvularcula flava]|uniref:Helix-turn-helix transcriptional regulator n=1 Tax=Aquisalinus luteolus TaxID=1566827 RepID=A0ABX0HFK2_9PROT|nr:helix-turn-helix transcriptional regulator [Aquisalinus luteolus]